LQENLVLPERAAVRTAMHWDAPGATPTAMLLPAIVERNAVPIPVEPRPLPGGAATFRAWVRDLVRLRQQELRHCRMSFALLDSGNDAVLAHSYEPGSGTIRCLHNLSPHSQEVDLPGIGAGALVLLSSEDNPAPARQSICLEGYGFRWLRSEEGEDAR
jgi:maltose alpha-D-glucosyltransferase/alpha-amylase